MFESVWRYKQEKPEDCSLLDAILRQKGVYDKYRFLNQTEKDLFNPFLLQDMDVAVRRILKAKETNEKICIYGDYDADGLTSSALLYLFLRNLGFEVECFIPDRFDDGYGLNNDSLGKLADRDISLVITTDCGINSVDEIKYLNSRGVDTIITDHHTFMGVLPAAVAVICCTRNDNKYPFPDLSGAGVALKLVQAINLNLGNNEIPPELYILSAIGTVADIVPLKGENRTIAGIGISFIRQDLHPGIKALLENTGTVSKSVNSYALGFIIGPRINAAGRMGNANIALNLLLETDYEKALEYADLLSVMNNKRKKEQQNVISSVEALIEKNRNLLDNSVIVAASENLNKGVIGIAASKISEKYKKPAILLSIANGIAEGSGRSRGSFSLIKALRYCSPLLNKFGGHDKAAGLSLNAGSINDFILLLNQYIIDENISDDLTESLNISLKTKAEQLTFQNIYELSLLEPTGMGNESPVFAVENVCLASYRKIGSDGRHLALEFESNGIKMNSVCFGSSVYEPLLFINERYDIAFEARINEYRGYKKVQLLLKDMKPAGWTDGCSNLVIVRMALDMLKCEKACDSVGKSFISGKLYEAGMPYSAETFTREFNSFLIDRELAVSVYSTVNKLEDNEEIDIRHIIKNGDSAKVYLVLETMMELELLKLAPMGMYKYNKINNRNLVKRELTDSWIYRIFCKQD